MAVHLLAPEHRWVCPNCDLTDVTHEVPRQVRMHPCAGNRGMTVPFLPEGTNAKVELVERQDYINGDIVQTDDEGKPWMTAVTTRDDGTDCLVYAPTAKGSLR
jgi:hypothetical protein